MHSGKIAENLKIEVAMREESIGAATVLWNGVAITNATGVMIDTLGYRESLWRLGVGTMLGQRATLVAAIYESDTDDPTAATAISGADFTAVTGDSDETQQEGSILLTPVKRYQVLRAEVQNAFSATETATIHVSAQCILGDKDVVPVSKTLVFDIES